MRSGTHASSPDRRTWCCDLELSDPSELRSVLPAAGQPRARVLVRLHGGPLGYVTVPMTDEVVDVAEVVATAEREFADRIRAHAIREFGEPVGTDRLPARSPSCPDRVSSDELVSVVVCTRNRTSVLADCLRRLQALTYAHVEIVVVDNSPSDDSTRRLVDEVAAGDARFRYVLEPRPGLSAARNKGLAEARGAYVAYTDDDVAVDAEWVQGLLRGFARRPDVGCVTGLVATAGISGPEEEYFDARTSYWSARCVPQLFDLDSASIPDSLYPYSPGLFGTGANFAFDRAFLRSIGSFDEALGAGTPTRGGEDLDIFVRALHGGRSIAYEPSALVWHHHRADHEALLSQVYGYGTGLSAFITKCLMQPGMRGDVLRRVPVGLRRLARIRAETTERLPDAALRPRGVQAREAAGMISGPWLYLSARRRVAGDSRSGDRPALPAV